MMSSIPPLKKAKISQELIPVLRQDQQASKSLLTELFMESVSTFEDYKKLFDDSPLLQKALERKFKKTIFCSPGIKISILSIPSKPSKVIAELESEQDSIDVELPDTFLQESGRLLSQAKRVRQVLYNLHLEPTFIPEKNKVVFKPVSFGGETQWGLHKEHGLPSGSSNVIYRLDGTIAYTLVNNIVIWDWENDKFERHSLITGPIKILKELPSKKLAVINDKKQLFIEGIGLISIEGDIKNIFGININHCIIQLEEDYLLIYDLENKQIIQKIVEYDEVLPLNESCFAVLKNEPFKEPGRTYTLSRFVYDKGEYLSEKIQDNIKGIIILSNSKAIILFYKKDTSILWDYKTNIEKQYPSKGIQQRHSSYDKTTHIALLGLSTLFYITEDRGKLRGNFVYEASADKIETIKIPGSWSAKAISPLTNSSIIYGNDNRGAGIHIISEECKKISLQSLDKKLLKDTNNRLAQNFIELPNGYIAIDISKTNRDTPYPRSITIIKPSVPITKDKTKSKALTKESSSSSSSDEKSEKDELKDLETSSSKAPTSSTITPKSPTRDTLEKEEQIDPYTSLLAQLCQSVKEGNLYLARRSYEKARELRPTDKEPCDIFLFYLNNSPYTKLRNQVSLDLCRLKNQVEIFSLRTKKYKKRLIIGEGSGKHAFSYTEALINKHKMTHPGLGKSIVSTELDTLTSIFKGIPATKSDPYPKPVEDKKNLAIREKRIIDLQKRGVKILFGIDATSIHRQFARQKFQRIHWNCPFAVGRSEDVEKFKAVIPGFFRSASKLQNVKDRIHVTLMQEKEYRNDYWKSRQIQNPIVLGATSAGYRLIRKRAFSKTRYPGYQHEKTGGGSPGLTDQKREFIFEKTSLDLRKEIDLVFANALINPKEKKYSIKTDSDPKEDSSKEEKIKPVGLEEHYFECSTDEDSSDYYEEETSPLQGLEMTNV